MPTHAHRNSSSLSTSLVVEMYVCVYLDACIYEKYTLYKVQDVFNT
jgi:hypothetical protein